MHTTPCEVINDRCADVIAARRMRDPACETRMRHGDASEHRGQFALFTRIYWDHRDFFMCVGVRGQHLLLLSGSAPCSGLHSGG